MSELETARREPALSGTGESAAAGARRHASAIGAVLFLLGALTLLRIGVLAATHINLGPEEAQYWSWAQHLAFGYFSKPPMIAWAIAGTTSLCGDGEPCVRLAAPLFHVATALLIFFLTRRLYDVRTALWAAVAFATLPAVWLSSVLITTDVPLIFFWALALLSYHRLIVAHESGVREDALRWGAIAGAAIGLGFLSKYAMVYFFLCAGGHLLFSRDARRAILSPAGVLAIVVALIVAAPNLLWNIQEGFATLRHTAANANWQGTLFRPDKLVEFVGGQFAVFGPVLMFMFLWGLMTLRSRMASGPKGADLLLLCFSAPILLIALGQAFVSRANANWAGPAYVAATILVVAWLVRSRDKDLFRLGWLKAKVGVWLRISLATHLIGGFLTYALITVPGAIEFLGMENAFKRLRGWDTLAAELARHTAGGSYRAVMTDHRLVTAEILYYGRELGLPIVVFDSDGAPGNEYELRAPYRPEIGDPVLYASYFMDTSQVRSHFRNVQPLETFRMQRALTPPPAPPAQAPWLRPPAKYDLQFFLYRLAEYRG